MRIGRASYNTVGCWADIANLNGDTMILKRRTKNLRGNCLDLIMLATARVVFILLLGFRCSSGN